MSSRVGMSPVSKLGSSRILPAQAPGVRRFALLVNRAPLIICDGTEPELLVCRVFQLFCALSLCPLLRPIRPAKTIPRFPLAIIAPTAYFRIPSVHTTSTELGPTTHMSLFQYNNHKTSTSPGSRPGVPELTICATVGFSS